MGMKCHYEVLGVPRDADDDAIKKSYRKLALKLHPDKNLDNIEQATLEFRIVQQAYDVLSDPQERAWYDKHREAILMGGMGKGDDYEDNSLDVYAYFNSSCYFGYDDDENGFYTIYRGVFERLAEEDYLFMSDKDSDYELPGFGDSESDYDEVVGPFYGFWESYCTAKSYVWCEKWDTRDAPDRMTRRAMEQENRKLCEAKRKERNEEVRALVAFVKKRDRRVIAHRKFLEKKAEEAAKIAKEKRLNERKERLQNMENYTEEGWSATANLDDELQALEDQMAAHFQDTSSSVDDEEETVEDSPYCVVCNKIFKTDKALRNHEKSKKHREALEALKEEMKADDEFADDELVQMVESDGQLSPAPCDEPTRSSKKKKKRRKQQQSEEVDKNSDSFLPNSAEDLCDRLQSVSVNDVNDTATVVLENGVTDNKEPSDDEFVHKSANKNKKKNKKKNNPSVLIAETDPVSELTCKVCQVTMESRNRLFTHIKETGHAAPKLVNKDVNPSATEREEKSKKRNKKNKKSNVLADRSV